MPNPPISQSWSNQATKKIASPCLQINSMERSYSKAHVCESAKIRRRTALLVSRSSRSSSTILASSSNLRSVQDSLLESSKSRRIVSRLSHPLGRDQRCRCSVDVFRKTRQFHHHRGITVACKFQQKGRLCHQHKFMSLDLPWNHLLQSHKRASNAGPVHPAVDCMPLTMFYASPPRTTKKRL